MRPLKVTNAGTLAPRLTRSEHHRANGYHTTHWRTLRAAAIRRDRTCTDCGTRQDLTVDLNDTHHGDHRTATLNDVTTRCRPCHATRHGNET